MELTTTPNFYEGWNYEASDKALKHSIKEWRNLTENVLSECFLMYKYLVAENNKRKSTNSPNVTNVTFDNCPTWREWCEGVGVSYNTFYRHFQSAGWIETKQKQLPTVNEEDERGIRAILNSDENNELPNTREKKTFNEFVNKFGDSLIMIPRVLRKLNNEALNEYEQRNLNEMKQSIEVRNQVEEVIKTLRKFLKA